MIHSFPTDIIQYIGMFLDPSDQRSCLLATKVLAPVTHSCKTHVIKFDMHNSVHGIARLQQTLDYISKIKPNIKYILIQFSNITSLSHSIEFRPKNVSVMIKNCRAANTILSQLSNKTRIMLIDEQYIPDINYDELSKKRIEYINIRNSRMVDLFTHKFVSKIQQITFEQIDSGPVDLKFVDTTHNMNLTVNILASDFTCTYPWKITHVVDFSAYNVLFENRFVSSILGEDNFKERSRLKRVCIYHNINPATSTWIYIIKLLPCNVEYLICPQDPNVYAFIESFITNGVTNIRYFYYNRDTYLRALIARSVSPLYSFDMECISDRTVDNDMNRYATIGDVYNDLNLDGKQKWNVVYITSKSVPMRKK